MGRRRGTSAFPVARIKKMMQSDDDVGKIATVTPVLVAKALELMMEHVLKEAAQVATDRHTKTVTPQHLKTCVMNNDSFDFLRDVLKGVQALDDDKPRRRVRAKRPRSPVNEGRRVRRGRDDANSDVAKEEKVKEAVVEDSLPVPSHVAVVVEKGKPDDEDDDYDEDDDNAGGTANDAKDPSVPLPVDSQSAPARMSVSALLS